MKKLFNSSFFQVYAFIFFFIIINVYVVFNVNVEELFNSYIMIYLFWLFIILVLKIISHFVTIEEEKDV